MAAKDYKIMCACFNAYIGKPSKKQKGLMCEDRKVIEDGEILMLIDWFLDLKAKEGESGITFDSHRREGMKISIMFEQAKNNDL